MSRETPVVLANPFAQPQEWGNANGDVVAETRWLNANKCKLIGKLDVAKMIPDMVEFIDL